MREYTNPKTILNAVTANGAGSPDKVKDYRHLVIEVITVAFTGTVKFQGSLMEEAPTFGSAQSITNSWDYVQTKDLQNASTIDGDTGIAFSGSTDVRQLEINTNVLTWFDAIVSSYSAGSITVRLVAVND